jgi:glycosyltransferase involved in cell wall biosynthesis
MAWPPLWEVISHFLLMVTEVFVLPSRYKSFDIPAFEAVASGLPVITTTAASLPRGGQRCRLPL